MTLSVFLRCVSPSSQERPLEEDPEGHQPEHEGIKRRKENGEMWPDGDMTHHGDGYVHPVTPLKDKSICF